MFLHLGSGIAVRLEQVILISDYELYTHGCGEELVTRERRLGRRVISCLDDSDDRPRTLVLTNDNIYLSPISPLTLKRRADTGYSNLA